MAIAFTAWLIAPAPMACTSTLPLLRMTPAMAPATATGLEVADTFSTSTGARPLTLLDLLLRVFSVDSLDRCCPAAGGTNGNQYRVESHRPRGHHEPVGHAGQKALQDHVFVHADAAVAGPYHADVRDVGGTSRQDPGVGSRDVRVRAHDRADPPVQVPAHRRFLRGRLGVHVAEDDAVVGVLGEDGVGGAKRVVDGLHEDPAHHVHDQDLVAVGFERAPALARGAGRIVRRTRDALQLRQLREELLLSEYVIAGGDHVGARGLDLLYELCRQTKAAGGVLSVDHGHVRFQLALESRQERLDRVAARMPDHVGDEKDAELVGAHRSIVGKTRKGARRPGSLVKFLWCASRPGFPGPSQTLPSVSGLARRQLPEGVPRGSDQ